ncbi:unnamed protein product [Phytophthora lilii]|uniref:Unnamed protein product n=1 Tax=Phytophthora lilii TaxID=2077276 RepID=A0A9W6TYJ5_9STRA|nr:unnamed protein product [Phytophthora lilii]
MAADHMAIAGARCELCVDDTIEATHELFRIAQEERARTAELLASFVTRAQLDAALSTKVSVAHVDAQMDAMRSEVAAHLDQKADLASLITLQSTKLDVSVFDANAWDLHKLRVAMEQHVRDLFATFAGQVELQVSSKLGIEDFNRVFNPEATGQKASLETAALRISKMTDQLDSLSNYMSGDRQRQRQVAELNVNMLDLTRKQAAARNSIVQLESAEEATTAQLRALDEQTSQAVANLQSLTETLSGLQAQTQADKSAQDARQARLVQNVKQLEAHSQHLSKTLSELERFAHSGLVDSIDTKLKTNNDKLRNELNEATTVHRQHAQQLNQRMNKANDLLLHHKERLAQLDACLRKLAGLLKETQGDLNNVKGPLATLATNLHEENVAILQEIERSQRSAGPIRSNRSPSIPWRAQTAGSTPKVLTDPVQPPTTPDNNASFGNSREKNPIDREQELRIAATVSVRKPGSRDTRIRHESVPPSFFRQATGSADGDLFHFPTAESSS